MNDILSSINTVVLEKLKQDALGHNNTEAWIENGVLYIDSMKNASAFNEIAKIPNVKFEIIHRANEEQYRWAMTGEGKFNTPTIGGRETICNVYKVTLK